MLYEIIYDIGYLIRIVFSCFVSAFGFPGSFELSKDFVAVFLARAILTMSAQSLRPPVQPIQSPG